MENEKLIPVLARIAAAFHEKGIRFALGGSMMLLLRGLPVTVHDLDLMVFLEDAELARAQLALLGTTLKKESSDRFVSAAFHRFAIDGVEVDLIAGFAIKKEGEVLSFPLQTSQMDGEAMVENQKVPLHALKQWEQFYTLMDRQDKLRMIKQAAGADAGLLAGESGKTHG